MTKHKNPPRDYSIRKLEGGPLGGQYVEVTGGCEHPDGTWYVENEVPEFFGFRVVGFDGSDSRLAPRYDSYADALEAGKGIAKQMGASLDDRYDREHPWKPGEWEQALNPN